MSKRPETKSSVSPPFARDVQLNSEPLDESIPGEHTPIHMAGTFLLDSLTQQKANALFNHLWFAGTPGKFRPLHEQLVFRRIVIPCENPQLHLVWFNDAIYVKPLPPCLTNYEFWRQHICPSHGLFSLASGLLWSYVHLIRHESDFRIAIDLGLLRTPHLTWERWQQFRVAVESFLYLDPWVTDKRYRYGELRLSRLNVIYSIKFMSFAGYHNAYTQYGPYFSRYFAAAILIFAFASVILNAMQVVLQQAIISQAFATTSYRFAVAILVTVISIITVMTAVFVPVVIFDLRSGLIANRKLAKEYRETQQP